MSLSSSLTRSVTRSLLGGAGVFGASAGVGAGASIGVDRPLSPIPGGHSAFAHLRKSQTSMEALRASFQKARPL
jgi:hypothetical protein